MAATRWPWANTLSLSLTHTGAGEEEEELRQVGRSAGGQVGGSLQGGTTCSSNGVRPQWGEATVGRGQSDCIGARPRLQWGEARVRPEWGEARVTAVGRGHGASSGSSGARPQGGGLPA